MMGRKGEERIACMSVVLLRFADLKARGIISNGMTLKRWIDHEGFPPGIRLGPNSRAWDEAKVAEWLASRPSGGTTKKKVGE
jgi:hypothetical protein